MYFQSALIRGPFLVRDSLLHNLDPRTKVFCALALMSATFAVDTLPTMAWFSLLIFFLFPLSRLPIKYFLGNLKSFSWLLAITFLLHLFLHSGTTLFTLPLLGWTITQEGLQASGLYSLRIVALLSLFGLILVSTAPQDLTDGLERFFKPLRRLGIPVSEMTLIVSLALRFVPILWEEGDKIRRAQMSRGAALEGSLWLRPRQALPLILPLFAGALKKADDLSLALQARAYRGGQGRTSLVNLQIGYEDALAFLLTFIFISLVWLSRFRV